MADGATHMATDQAIAEQASRLNCPTVRIYHWFPCCVSLGYHQNTDILDLHQCEQEGIDVVRRPTGGRAVFHSEEWTYAVILPSDWPGAGSTELVYKMISEGLVSGLNKLGVPARMERRPLDLHRHYRSELASSCFSAAAKYEVIADEKKLVGSAQRRMMNGILQHGSILTGEAHAKLPLFFEGLNSSKKERMSKIIQGKATCIQDLIGRIPSFEEGAEAIRSGMEEALGIRLKKGELSKEEKLLMPELKAEFSILASGKRMKG